MRAMIIAAFAGLTAAVATAQAETIKLHCTLPSDPKSETEDYVVDTDDNTVTAILHDIHGNVLSSNTYPAKVSATAIDWTKPTPGTLVWTQHYDRTTGTLTSSNNDDESFTETCKVAR
jgi:hypothetical protein